LDRHHEPEDQIKIDVRFPTLLDTAGEVGRQYGQDKFKGREKYKGIKNSEITPNALEVK
jgi:hypothetical protein